MRKVLTATIWSIVILFILFAVTCIFAGAGYLFNVIFGLPIVAGIAIFAAIEVIVVALICWIES